MADGYSMDRAREPDSRRLLRPIAWAVAAVLLIVAFIVADRLWLRPGVGLDLQDFMTAEVRRGELAIEVQGAGALEPISERWVTAEVAGVVQQILARPGHEVAAGSRIALLVNPQLQQAVNQARLGLAEVSADQQRHRANLTDRRLTGEARLLAAQADYDENRLRLEAQEELRDQQAVSEIDYRTQQIRTQQAESQLEFETRRFEELGGELEADLAAGEARLEARREALRSAEQQVRDLAVATDMAGTIRELFVDPGQRVAAGGQIARVVDTTALMGVVRVPESYASHLVLGQEAVVTVLGTELPGRVSRVDPAVTQGSVTVDLELEGALPQGARPDLSIRATITVARMADALHMRRPLNARDLGTADVFRLTEDGQAAQRTTVRFGLGTLREIEVVDGLAEGDTVILGDTARYEDEETIVIR